MARETFFSENEYTTSLAGRLYRHEFIDQLIKDLPDAFRVCGFDMLKAGFEKIHLHSLNYFENIWSAVFEEKLSYEIAFVGVGKWIGIIKKKHPNYLKEFVKSLDNNYMKVSYSYDYWLLDSGESILEFLEVITVESKEKKESDSDSDIESDSDIKEEKPAKVQTIPVEKFNTLGDLANKQGIGNEVEPKEQKPKTEKKLLSYHWLNEKESEIRQLYDMLKNGDYISGERRNFLKIFTKHPTNDLVPIIWKSNNASELIYFIIRLMETSLIDNENRMSHERLKSCFVKTDGKKFTGQFKNLKKGLETNFSGFKKSTIDAIIKELS